MSKKFEPEPSIKYEAEEGVTEEKRKIVEVAEDLKTVKSIGCEGRIAATTVQTPQIEQYATENNLDIKSASVPGGVPFFVIAEKKRTSEALEERLYNFDIPPRLKKGTETLYNRIKNLPLVEAISFAAFYKYDTKKNMESPESALVLGLSFGYKPCCIKYYLETRFFGREKYPNEELYCGGQVHCKECAKKLAKEWGDSENNL